MKNNQVSSKPLGELGALNAGTKSTYLKQEDESSNNVKVKLINWSNSINLVNEQQYNCITEYYTTQQKIYKKQYCILEKGDILFSNLPSLTGENILYIDRVLDDNVMCSDNVYVFKNKSDYPSEYIYIVLKSGLYNKYLQYLEVGYNKKLTIKMLLDLEIPLLQNPQELVKEYSNLQKAKKEIQKHEEEFNNKVYELTKRTLNF